MSCSRTQHAVACGDRTQDLSIRSPTLYHYATALPLACKVLLLFWHEASVVQCLCHSPCKLGVAGSIPGFFGWVYKPRSRLHMTLAVGGTLNPYQPTIFWRFILTNSRSISTYCIFFSGGCTGAYNNMPGLYLGEFQVECFFQEISLVARF